MDHKAGRYFGLCASMVAVSLAFTAPAFFPMRVLWYYPLQRRWAIQIKPSAIAMDFYGRTLMACVVGGIAFVVAYAIGSRLKAVRPRAFVLWASWVATAVLLAMAVYTYQLAFRVPVPEPLPSWYTPQ